MGGPSYSCAPTAPAVLEEISTRLRGKVSSRWIAELTQKSDEGGAAGVERAREDGARA